MFLVHGNLQDFLIPVSPLSAVLARDHAGPVEQAADVRVELQSGYALLPFHTHILIQIVLKMT